MSDGPAPQPVLSVMACQECEAPMRLRVSRELPTTKHAVHILRVCRVDFRHRPRPQLVDLRESTLRGRTLRDGTHPARNTGIRRNVGDP